MAAIMTSFQSWRKTVHEQEERPPEHIWKSLREKLSHQGTRRRLRHTRVLTYAASILILVVTGIAIVLMEQSADYTTPAKYSQSISPLVTQTEQSDAESIYSVERVKEWRRVAESAY